MFSGSIVALVTPMQANGEIDWACLRELIEWQIAAGTAGIVVAGTTGEAAALTLKERQTLIQETVRQVNNRIPVIAGTGSSSTQETIELTLAAMQEGVDAALIVTPAYVKPTQEGLYQHYRTIAKQAGLPIILYNVPSRTACDLLPTTVQRLAAIPNIVGIKEAMAEQSRIQELVAIDSGALDVLSGDDAAALECMLMGGKGVISVTANVAPDLMAQMCQAALAKDLAKAQRLHQQLMPLHQQLFIESNPIPVKWALEYLGKIKFGIRLPLTPLTTANQAAVAQAIQKVGIRFADSSVIS